MLGQSFEVQKIQLVQNLTTLIPTLNERRQYFDYQYKSVIIYRFYLKQNNLNNGGKKCHLLKNIFFLLEVPSYLKVFALNKYNVI